MSYEQEKVPAEPMSRVADRMPAQTVSQAEVLLWNRIAARNPLFHFRLGPDQFRLCFLPRTPLFSAEISLKIRVGGGIVQLDLERFFIPLQLKRVLEGENTALLPVEIREALVEAAMEDCFDRFEALAGMRAVIREVQFNPHLPVADPFKRTTTGKLLQLAFRIVRENMESPAGTREVVRGCFYLEREALQWMLPLIDSMPAGAPSCDLLIPVEAQVEIGRTRLPIKVLKGIDPGDVILVDGNAWSEAGFVRVRIDSRIFCKGVLKDYAVTLLARMEEEEMEEDLMTDRTQLNEDREDEEAIPLVDPDELMIGLSFEIGRTTLPLGDLMSLRSGYTFELERGLDKPVSIKANGRLIGYGELVQVAGKVGVRVAELLWGQHEGDS